MLTRHCCFVGFVGFVDFFFFFFFFFFLLLLGLFFLRGGVVWCDFSFSSYCLLVFGVCVCVCVRACVRARACVCVSVGGQEEWEAITIEPESFKRCLVDISMDLTHVVL